MALPDLTGLADDTPVRVPLPQRNMLRISRGRRGRRIALRYHLPELPRSNAPTEFTGADTAGGWFYRWENQGILICPALTAATAGRRIWVQGVKCNAQIALS
jgi:hypothetical protein